MQNLLVVSVKPEQLMWVNKKRGLGSVPPLKTLNVICTSKLTAVIFCWTQSKPNGQSKLHDGRRPSPPQPKPRPLTEIPRCNTFLSRTLKMIVTPTQTIGAALLIFIMRTTTKTLSHHNGVQPFISHLTTWFRTRRFSEPTFRPSGATNPWKNEMFGDFPTFSRAWIFFLLRLFFLTLFLLLFSSLLFASLRFASLRLASPRLASPRVAWRRVASRRFASLRFSSLLFSGPSHLFFSSIHIVGSLTSKRPSVIPHHTISHHITSHHITSYHIISYHVIS